MTSSPQKARDSATADRSGTPMIELRKLTKAFGRKMALRGVDLRVAPGESLVIFGPNGAGKTTLMRILASLSRPTAGSVYIAGLDLKTYADGIRRHLGVVSHAPLLYDSLTAEENLRFFGRLYGVPNLEARITELLEQVGLLTRRKDLVRTFSRGMTQRLAIARALLHDPEILLLDEPDTGLDPQAAEMLHHLLAELSGRSLDYRVQAQGAAVGATWETGDAAMGRRGDAEKALSPSPGLWVSGALSKPAESIVTARTIVTVTHNLERGLVIADRVVILANGRLVYEADAKELTPADLRPLYDQYVGGGR